MRNLFRNSFTAVALLALASCSNEDFGGSYNKSDKAQLFVTIENPDASSSMRAAFTSDMRQVVWQTGDAFRAYNDGFTAFDLYEYKSGAISLTKDKANVAEHKMILFPSKNVYATDYDPDTNDYFAFMNVSDKVTYAGADKSGNATAYASELPLWCPVTKEDAQNNIEATLAHLGAFTNITVYKGSAEKPGAKFIRIIAAKKGVAKDAFKDVATAEIATNKANMLASENEVKTPLAGIFRAQLKTDGILVPDWNNPISKDSYKYVMEVEVYGDDAVQPEEAHIIVPIVPATYENLIIEENDGVHGWTLMKQYTNAKVERKTHIYQDLVSGAEPTGARVTGLADLNAKLALLDSDQGVDEWVSDDDVVNVYVKEGSTLETSYDCYQLVLPEKEGLTINIHSKIANKEPNLGLQIVGGQTGKKTILNIDGIEGDQKIDINTDCDLVLTGNFTSSEATKPALQFKTIQVQTEADVQLGLGVNDPFNTNMTVLLGGTANGGGSFNGGKLTVSAGNGQIPAIEYAEANEYKNNDIVVESGNIGTIGSETVGKIGTGSVTVNGGTITSIATTSSESGVEGAVTVYKGTATTITTLNGNVTVGAAEKEVKVDNINTTDGNIAITEAVVTNVTAGESDKADQTLTLTGGSGNKAVLAKITNLKVAAGKKLTVTSVNKAAIVNLVTTDGASDKVNFVSRITNAKASEIKVTEIGAENMIFTAAQLAGISDKSYTLRTNVVMQGAKSEWTPVDLKGNFTLTQARNITNLNAPLFGTISGTVTVGGDAKKLLTIKNSNIKSDEADNGALAKVVSGTATIKYIVVDGLTLEADEDAEDADEVINFGGLVGKVTGSVALQNNTISGTIKAYANVGGYVGNFAGTSFEATVDDATTYAGTVSFETTNDDQPETNTSNNLAGTFGYFIGSITKDAAKIVVAPNKAGVGDALSHYFLGSMDNVTSTFEWHKLIEGNKATKKFVGMSSVQNTKTYEFGWSSANSLDAKSYIYKDETSLGNDKALKIETINVFEDIQ